MPNTLQNGAAWIGQQLRSHAGIACRYTTANGTVDVTLVRQGGEYIPQTTALLNDQRVAAKADIYTVVRSDLSLVGDGTGLFLPLAGDEIEWDDQDGEIRQSIVFPVVRNRCYRFVDSSKTRLEIYTVALDSLLSIRITAADGMTFSGLGIPTTISGAEAFSETGQTKRLLTCAVYMLRKVFDEHGIDTPPMMAKVDAHGLPGWSVGMSETEWGEGIVRLGLERETLAREWQARRNGTI